MKSKNHFPFRTCIICRKKEEQTALLRFVLLNNEIVFDFKRKIFAYGYYVCKNENCLNKLEKWLKKKKKY